MKKELFDVVAVNIKTGSSRLMATNKTERNAEAIINMAVVRRGVDVEFYDAIPAGQTVKRDNRIHGIGHSRK